MRILFLTLGSPLDADRGARVRDRELIVRVAGRHDVSVLPVLEPGQRLGTDAEIERRCEVLQPVVVDPGPSAAVRRLPDHFRRRLPLASLRWVTEELLECVRQVVGDGRYELVQIEHSLLAPCVDSLPADVGSVLSLHNVGTFQYLSMSAAASSIRGRGTMRAGAWLLRRLESSYLPRFRGVVVVSEDDRRLLQQLSPGVSATVVPNGVDHAANRLLAGDGEDGTLLFVGNLAYPPNADAVVEFCSRSLPVLRSRVAEANLIVAGPDPPVDVRELASDSVRILGRVDELEPLYRRAQVVIVPLRAGGGARLKVLEAMAFGRCVVSTPLGAAGHPVVDGRELLLAAPGPPFALRIEEALRDPELRRGIAQRARRFVERERGWDRCVEPLLELYESLDRSGSPSGESAS